MQFLLRVPSLAVLFFALFVGFLQAEPASVEPSQILNNYLAASRSQRDRLNGSSAEVSIEADLPQLQRHGRLSALRHISRLGRITYDVLRFEGDRSVKNEVIARYLTAEVETRESDDTSLAIVPQNYKFSYKGLRALQGRDLYVFELKPRHKRKGLFRGTLWIDAQTYLPVRECGFLVKNPSVFIKRIQFTRDYQTTNGLAVVARVETTVETRIVGQAHMTVQYADYRFEPSTVELGQIATDSQ